LASRLGYNIRLIKENKAKKGHPKNSPPKEKGGTKNTLSNTRVTPFNKEQLGEETGNHVRPVRGEGRPGRGMTARFGLEGTVLVKGEDREKDKNKKGQGPLLQKKQKVKLRVTGGVETVLWVG